MRKFREFRGEFRWEPGAWCDEARELHPPAGSLIVIDDGFTSFSYRETLVNAKVAAGDSSRCGPLNNT
jgi:hypothetical protein